MKKNCVSCKGINQRHRIPVLDYFVRLHYRFFAVDIYFFQIILSYV